MTIYVDPTEVRDGTRLPQGIMDMAVPLMGLEAATGADILISKPGLEGRDITKMPWRFKWREWLQDGMLIQRKTDGDLLGSIPHLSSIFQRMQLATEGTNCWIWLLMVGVYTPSEDGSVTYKGVRFDQTTNWNWRAMQGALDMWQLRGGLVHAEPNDGHAETWIKKWDERLPRFQSELERNLGPRQKSRLEGGTIEAKPWRLTLESFPGLGSETSYRIAERCGRLIDAIQWITWGEPKLEGVGKATMERWQKWLGLREGETLVVLAPDGFPADLNSGAERAKDQRQIEEMQRRLLHE